MREYSDRKEIGVGNIVFIVMIIAAAAAGDDDDNDNDDDDDVVVVDAIVVIIITEMQCNNSIHVNLILFHLNTAREPRIVTAYP